MCVCVCVCVCMYVCIHIVNICLYIKYNNKTFVTLLIIPQCAKNKGISINKQIKDIMNTKIPLSSFNNSFIYLCKLPARMIFSELPHINVLWPSK